MSVITPVFNGAQYVAELLQSVSNQDFKSFEHILVNDGSTDTTAEVINEYIQQSQSSNIRVINQKNMGEAAAINTAAIEAGGDYLIIINVDDPIYQTALSRLVNKLEGDKSIVVAYPDWEMINSAGETMKIVRTLDFSKSRLIEDVQCLPGPGAMIRKSALDRSYLRSTQYRYLSDYEQWLYLSTKGDFARVPDVLATWRSHEASATSSSRGVPVMKEYSTLLAEVIENITAFSQGKKLNQRHIESSYYYFMSIQKLSDSRVPGRRMILKSLAKTYLRQEPGKRRSFVIIFGVLFYPSLNLAASVARRLDLAVPPFILGLPAYTFRRRH